MYLEASAVFPFIIRVLALIFSIYYSTLIELAGFILEALIDCQLTVNNAITIDASKDTPKVQNGKLSRYSKFSSHFFIANPAMGQATKLAMITHLEKLKQEEHENLSLGCPHDSSDTGFTCPLGSHES